MVSLNSLSLFHSSSSKAFRLTLIREVQQKENENKKPNKLIMIILIMSNYSFVQGEYIGFDEDEPTSASHGKAKVAQLLKTNFDYNR